MTPLRDFPALVALADELHFGRAAERLGISQPQLSIIIKRIESRSRVLVFERRPAVRPTPAGEALIDSARRAIAEAELGLSQARAVASGTAGPVRFGFAPISLLTPLGAALEGFARDSPKVDLQLTEQHSGPLIDDLQRRRLDLIVARQAIADPHAQSVEIYREPMILAVPSSHRLSANERTPISDLADEPIITWRRDSAPDYFDEMQRSFEQSGFHPHVAQAVNGWSSLLALVAAGLGVGIVSKSVGRIGFPGVAYRELDGFSASARFWLSWFPKSIPPAAERLRRRLLTISERGGDPAPQLNPGR